MNVSLPRHERFRILTLYHLPYFILFYLLSNHVRALFALFSTFVSERTSDQ